MNPITVAEIRAAQKAWGEGLVSISTAYAEGKDYGTVAGNVLDTLYGYADGVVLFKPTLVAEVPFRYTRDGAASYFLGKDVTGSGIAEDGGFAIKPWRAVQFEDGEVILSGETALWMGAVHITNDQGAVTTVHKTFGYYRAKDGSVKIQVHHSSVPFKA